MHREEVYHALQGIGHLKALEADGFNAFFFKKSQKIVGGEIIKVVLYFFLHWHLIGLLIAL